MPLNGRKILIAEDEPDQLHFIKTVLEDNGATVVVASNGTQALSLVRSELPHAMTLDINMPGMDVMELLGELKGDETLNGLKICIVSGRPELRLVLRDRHLNANGYLDKPFTEDDAGTPKGSILGLTVRGENNVDRYRWTSLRT
jgi:CheY-like chemotaxis protein